MIKNNNCLRCAFAVGRMVSRLLVAGVLLVTVSAHATSASQPADGAAPGTMPTQRGGSNAITQTAVSHGVLTCARRIEQLTDVLGFGPQAGALLMLTADHPDARIVPLAMEVPVEHGSAYVSASFAPERGHGCDATYDAVVYWPKSCPAVATHHFEKMKQVGVLKKGIVVLDGGIATKVFLMPAGSGCVSVKKEFTR